MNTRPLRACLLAFVACVVPACGSEAPPKTAGDPGTTAGGQPAGLLGPSVAITSPGQGATFDQDAPIPISVVTEDTESIVLHVEFYHDGNLIGSSRSFPFSIVWQASTPGTYTLTAIATDQNGQSASAAPVVIRVLPPPLPSSSSGWIPQDSATSAALRGVCFVSATTGWVVGEGGTILKTMDAGVRWSPQSSGTAEMLTRVQFVSSTQGWAVGGEGTVLSTVDGGASWTRRDTGTTDFLWGLSFVSSSTGWVTGGDRRILKTTDGGATWQDQSPVDQVEPRCIAFVSDQRGWVAGAGYVLSTADGGAHWTQTFIEYTVPSSLPEAPNLQDGRFFNDTTGVFVGADRNGAVELTTRDGGATWTVHRSGVLTSLAGFTAVDALDFWAVGGTGMVVSSTDAGGTWASQKNTDARNLWSVWFVDVDQGWAVGDGGLILATTTGGRSGS